MDSKRMVSGESKRSAWGPLRTRPHGLGLASSNSTMISKAWLDIYIGDRDAYNKEKVAYDATDSVLRKNYAIYGLPSTLEELSEEQQDMLKELDVH